MIILSILSVFLNFLSPSITEDITCNQLIEVVSNHETGLTTYCNRYKIPVVDRNGKMMFDVSIRRTESNSSLSMIPAMKCYITPDSPVIITFVDQTQLMATSQNLSDGSQLDVDLSDEVLAKMMTSKILSLAFEGKKYGYKIVLKPNQGRVIQDVTNCLQN